MWIVLLLLAMMAAVVALGPWFKSYRTVIFNYIVGALVAVLPLIAELTGYLQSLDWRLYVKPEYAPWALLIVTVLSIILRYRTNSGVGEK